jgi:hypothetical protein
MRLVTINAPVGLGEKIRDTAFAAGVSRVSIHQVRTHKRNGDTQDSEAIKVETSTPKAKRFIDNLIGEAYYDRETITFSVRQPRAIISGDDMRDLTTPLAEPPTDLLEELWQFSRVSYGLVARVFIAGGLIAYGIINAKMLLMIGGLLFLPMLPMVMAISYGTVGRHWRLVREGAVALTTTTLLLFIAGMLVGAVSSPPLRSDESGASLIVGIILSLAVGIAGALASVDDAGRRELIGLATAGQIGIIPVWLGVVAVLGLPVGAESSEPATRILSFSANLFSLIGTILIVQLSIGVVGNIRQIRSR